MFLEEERVSWTTVYDSFVKKSFADVVRSPPLSGANLEPIGKPKISNSLRDRLQFPRRPAFDRLSAPANQPLAEPNRLTVACARCLLPGHPRVNCRQPVRCRACFGWGHVVAACRAHVQFVQPQESDAQRQQSCAVKAKAVAPSDAGLFKSLNAHRPSASEPPMFKSFGDLFKSISSIPAWACTNTVLPIIVPWPQEPVRSAQLRPTLASPRVLVAPDPAAWTLNVSSSSCRTTPSAVTVSPENPSPPCSELTLNSTQFAVVDAIAYQRADPTPFIPEGMQYQDVPKRMFMVRAVAPIRPSARNEDLAIATFNPLPGNEMQFAAVRVVLRDFLQFERPTAFLDIQPTHLGQALVRFTHTYDRDVMVAESPHVFGDVRVLFCKHNEGRNWRRAQFNHECWLLLLGLPNDYWTERHIHSAVGEFAKVLLWEADERFRCRLLIRVRVTDLERVLQFIAYSDPNTVDGESWTLQCEVLQQHPQHQQQGPQTKIQFLMIWTWRQSSPLISLA